MTSADQDLPSVIVASTPSRGHVGPMLQIAEDLVRRGYPVTVTTASAFAERARATGAVFHPLQGAADFDAEERTPDMRSRPGAPEPGPAVVDYDIAWTFVEPVPDQHDTLQTLRAEAGTRRVVLLCDNAFLGYWPVRLGAPGHGFDAVVAIGVNPLTISSVDTAPFGPGLPPDASEAGRERNRMMNAQFSEMLVFTAAAVGKVFGGFGLDAPASVLDGMVTMPDRFLELAPASVEYPRSDLPESVRFVGALPAAPSQGELPDWWPELVAAREQGRRVVTVTQGTLSNYDLSELIEPTLAALAAREDLYVVATTGRTSSRVTSVPGNARVETFIPYGALLPLTDVFVSNGGYGATLQALGLGIPLVLAGASEDKVEVNARLSWTGAAIDLRTARPGVADVASAVSRVLEEPEFRTHAARIAAEITELDPFTAIVEEIHSVLDHRQDVNESR